MDTKKSQPVIVVTYNGFQVRRDPMCYIVTELTEAGQPKPKTYTYHPSLTTAVENLSERVFVQKLTARAAKGQDDLASLTAMLKAHRAEMRRMYRT